MFSMCLLTTACSNAEHPPQETANAEQTAQQQTTAVPSPSISPTASPQPATASPSPTAGPQVVITKSPSDESVSVGGNAWFIAHADNANSIEWLFVSPDGSNSISSADIGSKLSGLEVETLPEDTIALRSIPLEMDGWKVQARFNGDGNSATTTPAIIYVSDYLSAYASVIDNCRYVVNCIANGTDYGSADTYGISASYDLLYNQVSLGYALKDIDGNGIPELIVGATSANDFGENGGNIVYSLFTLQDGSPLKIFSSYARSCYYMSQLGGFYFHGSNGAANSYSYIYSLNGIELKAVDGVWSDGLNENNELLAYYFDGTKISQEQFNTYSSQYEASILSLPTLTPIT